MSIDKSQFVTPTQLAKMLGISRIAVHQKIKKGEIKAENIGDPSKPTYVIPKSSLSEELQNRISEEQKSVTKKVLDKNHHHDLSFEKELWMAADKLRGNVDVSEYKNIVLGLLFLKYISDSFYKRREVLAELTKDPKNEDFYVPTEDARKAILETKDFYTSEGVFYVPEKSRWEFLQTKTMNSDLGKILDTAMELIEKDNPVQLENVLPRVYTKVNLDHTVLGELVNIFSQISFDHDFDREKDILGRIYEYFLGQFASSEGKRGGEFFTPRSIVKLLTEILEPYENARVADFACGSGGMFVSMGEYLRDHKMDPSKLSISGQESNQNTLRLCKMNLAIRGLSGKIELGNTYYKDMFPHLQADFVIANPPFNAEWDPSKLSDNDPRIFLGIPPSGNANFLWLQHFVHHLAPNGQAGFVMPNGALAVSGKEGELRQKLIEADLVDVIISCPSKLFYNVSLPVSLWFLSKNKSGDRFRKRSGETLFIDAREIYEKISSKQVIFNKEHITKITNTVRAWRGEKVDYDYKDIPGFCKSLDLQNIRKGGYVLTPGVHVGTSLREEDKISFTDDLVNTHKFLKERTAKNNILDAKISLSMNSLYPNLNWNQINFSSNQVLEDLARSIFKEWFINFRFPGYEKIKMIDSEIGEIPEGWTVGKISNLGNVVCGKTPSKSNPEYFGGGIPFIKIPDMHGQMFIINTEDNLSQEGADTQKNKLIPEGSICVSCIATVGLVSITTKKSQTNQQINTVVPKNLIFTEYLYFTLLDKKNDLLSIGSGGSTTLNVNTSVFSNLNLLIPTDDLIQKFHEKINPIFEKIKESLKENSELKNSRNKLLEN